MKAEQIKYSTKVSSVAEHLSVPVLLRFLIHCWNSRLLLSSWRTYLPCPKTNFIRRHKSL